MKAKLLLFTLLTAGLSLFSLQASAQSTQQDSMRQKALDDKRRLNELSEIRKETKAEAKIAKARAKEASRLEKDAANAAKEAKQAAKMERKAQRNRMKADKQARKAEKALEKTND
ncbi:hypothetical protein [Rufibacter roseolus]|uniref:hypothetical protein n=1 Tax=Rufibacter roseolus TaxID=2817375 RepID=UPI001B30A999|nr:hypothetical protein [Rufibacter roseolus]